MILGIDTSAGQCGVALLDGGKALRAIEIMERGHAERLFPMIEGLLDGQGAEFSDLTHIGVCTGPGSFTGIRVGIAAARGLALGLGIASVGISRFDALVAQIQPDQACRVVLKGRGSTVFCQDFDAAHDADGDPFVADTADPVPAGWQVIRANDKDGPAVDPAIIARLASDRPVGIRPAPLYLRGADAAMPREGPPRLLDP